MEMEKDTVTEIPSPDKIKEEIKKLDNSKLFAKGNYIDAHDEYSWKVAIVLEYSPTSINFHYEGWSEKYDAKNVPLTSIKISPFRRFTSGYTGQQKQAYRKFKYQKDEKLEIQKKMEEMVTSRFQIEDSIKFTQFFRGDLFFYVDTLLTMLHLFPPSKEDTQDILKFLDAVLGTITEWIKILAENNEYWKLGQFYDLSHLIYPQISVAMAFSEILCLLKSFFGMNARCTLGFLHVYNCCNEKLPEGQTEQQQIALATSWCVKHFFKSFSDRGGIEALADLLRDPKSRISIFNINKFFGSLETIFQTYESEEINSAILSISEAIFNRIERCHENDMKEIESISPKNMWVLLDPIFKKCKQISQQDYREKLESFLLMTYLKHENLMRKVQGLEMLKDNFQVQLYFTASTTEIDKKFQEKAVKFISVIKEYKIIEMIFSDFPHPELIRRASEIIKILIILNDFQDKDISMLKSCYFHQHEENKIPILNLIIELAEYAPYEILEKIVTDLLKTKPEEISETFLKFLCIYTIKLNKNINKRNEMSEKTNSIDNVSQPTIFSSKVCDINLFWRVMMHTDSSVKVEGKIKEKALSFLIELCESNELIAAHYVAKSFEEIKSKSSGAIRAMKFLKQAHGTLNKLSKVYALFEANLNRKSNLFEETLQSLTSYKKKVEEKVKSWVKCEEKSLNNMDNNIVSNSQVTEEANIKKISESPKSNIDGSIKSDMQQPITMGTEFLEWKHEEYLRSYFDFIEFICKLSNYFWSLSPIHLKVLWDCFVVHPICSEETNFFFLQLVKSEFIPSKNKTIFSFLNEAGLKEVLSKYFLNPALFQLKKMNHIAYTCFKVIMVAVNIKNGSFKQEKDKLLTKDGNAEGVKELWTIVFTVEDKEVKEQASKFLISIYTMLDSKFRKQIRIISKSFAKNSLTYANDNISNKESVVYSVRLIKTYISEFEGDKYSKIDLKFFKQKPVIEVSCFIKLPEGKVQKYLLTIYENLTLHHILILLSSQLKVPRSRIVISKLPENTPITDKNERESIKTLTGALFVDIRDDCSSIEQMPSFYIANEENIYFNLMSFIKKYEDLGEEIWSLMKDFPDNESHLRKISSLKFSIESNPVLAWNKFLDEEQSIYELIYNVRVIKRLLRAQHFLLRPYFLQYVERFESKQGFVFLQCLLEKYISTPLNISTTRLVKYLIQCLAVCKKIAGAATLFQKLLNFLLPYINGSSAIPSAECDAVFVKCIPCAFSLLNTLGENIADFSPFKKQYLEFFHYIFSKSKYQTALEKISNFIIFNIKKEKINHIKFVIQCLLYDTLQNEEEQSAEYFDLLQNILGACSMAILDKEYLKTSKFLPTLATQISKAKSDTQKQGLIDVFSCLYTNFRDEVFELHNSWMDVLFSNLKNIALPSPDPAMHDAVLYQLQSMNKKVLQGALSLIFKLCLIQQEYVFEIIKTFSPLLKDSIWRTNSPGDWGIYIEDVEEKKAGQTKFVGLTNPGCICYMNSLLQQLFMLPLFRQGLLGASGTTEATEISLLHYMKILFGILKEGKRSAYNASHMCSLIKDYEGKHLSIYEQRDADEFFNLLMDRLEADLKKTNRAQLVKDVFGGSFANEIICIDCPHRSVRSEDFLALNVQIHNKRSLEESLQAFIESESLFGNNAYFCDRCERKVSAKKRVSLGVLPNTLMIVLKRFEFDFQNNTKRKINDYMEFPMELNMEKFSQIYQNRKDIMDRNKKEEELTKEEQLALNIQVCPEYFQYRLRGVVIHMGTADFGHYISLSYDRENSVSQDSQRWFEFNDSRVIQFNPDLMPMEAFGGGNEGKGTATMLDKKADFYGNIKNAYMLIYERVAYFHMPKIRQLYDDLKAATDIAKMEQEFREAKVEYNIVLQSSMSENIEQHLSIESSKSNTAKMVFNSLYFDLFNNLIKSGVALRYTNYEVLAKMDLQSSPLVKEISGFEDMYVDHFNKWQFFFRFVFTALLRVTLRSQIPPILRILTNVLKNDLALSLWILETFSHPLIIFEFYYYCISSQARYFVSSLLVSAFNLVMQAEQKQFIDTSNYPENLFKQIPVIQGKLELKELKDISLPTKSVERGKILRCHLFLFNYLTLFPKIFVNKTGFPEYCFLFSLLNRRHPEVRDYFLSNHLLGLCLEILLETQGSYMIEAGNREVILINQDISLGFTVPSTTKKEERITSLNLIFDNRNKQFKYLFDLVNILLSSTKNFTPADQYSLEEKEINLIKNFTVDTVLSKLFFCATSNVARQALSDILVSLSISQRENSKCLMEILLLKSATAELSDLPLYLVCLQKMLKIKDPYTEIRTNTLLAHLNVILVKYVPKSFFHYSYISDLLLNYARENSFTQKCFSENAEKYSFLMSWMKDNSYPAQGEIYWFKSQLKHIEVRKEVSKSTRALCKAHSNKKISLLKLLLSPSVKSAKEFLSIDFKEEEHHSLFHKDFTESCVLKKEFDIKLLRHHAKILLRAHSLRKEREVDKNWQQQTTASKLPHKSRDLPTVPASEEGGRSL